MEVTDIDRVVAVTVDDGPSCSRSINGSTGDNLEPASGTSDESTKQDNSMKCDLLVLQSIQVAGLEPLVNGCDPLDITVHNAARSAVAKSSVIDKYRSHSSPKADKSGQCRVESRNNFIPKCRPPLPDINPVNIAAATGSNNIHSSIDFSFRRNETHKVVEQNLPIVNVVGNENSNVEIRFENGENKMLDCSSNVENLNSQHEKKMEDFTRCKERRNRGVGSHMNGECPSNDGSLCAEDYEEGNIQMYEECYMEDSWLKPDCKSIPTCNISSETPNNVYPDFREVQASKNLTRADTEPDLEDRCNNFYKLYSDYLQQKEKLNNTDNSCVDCNLAPLAIAEDVDSSECDESELYIPHSFSADIQDFNVNLAEPRNFQTETSHPLFFFHDVERPSLDGQERLARLVRSQSHSPSMESVEDIGDYIDTDFPSRSNKLLFQSSSTQSSSSEPSSPDEGCVHGKHDEDNHNHCPMNDNVWQPLQINANCIAAVKPQAKDKLFDLPNSEEKLPKPPVQLLQRPNCQEINPPECIGSQPYIKERQRCVDSENTCTPCCANESEQCVQVDSDYQHFNGEFPGIFETGNHSNEMGACAIPESEFKEVCPFSDIYETPKPWTLFNDNLRNDSLTCEDCMFDCFPQTHRIMNYTNDLNIDTRSTRMYDNENTRKQSRLAEIQKMPLHFPGANFKNNECNQQEKKFVKYSLETRSLSSSEGEEENDDFDFEPNRLTNSIVSNGHIPQEPLNVTGQFVIQEPENADNITESLQAHAGSCPSRCREENFDTIRNDPVYGEICNKQKHLAEHESVPIIYPLPARFERRKKHGSRRHSDVEKVMIWNEYEAYVLQVKQIGTSACGPTAVMNVLKAFDFQVDKDEVCRMIVTNLRMETVPIPYYLFSRSAAGTTEEVLSSGISKLTRGTICGRFFHFSPSREVQLLKWLGYWIKKGAVPLATLNLQKGVKAGWSIPDAWHHQMIYGVSSKGVYLTNPLEIVPEETIMEQLTSESVLLVRRQDAVNRFRDWAPLNDLIKQKDEQWRNMNVLGQVVNVLREACSIMTQVPGYRAQLTSHVAIPAAYKAGITLFIRHNTDGYHELMSALDLPIKTDNTSR